MPDRSPFDALRGLKPLASRAGAERPGHGAEDARFVIADDGRISVLDANGRDCLDTAKAADDHEAYVLKTLRRSRPTDFAIDWAAGSTARGNNTADNPYLEQQLLGCRNIYDTQGRRLSVASDIRRLSLHLSADGTGKDFVPHIHVDDDGIEPVIISSTLVRCGTRLQPIADLGPNWRQLGRFVSQFPADSLESYLSVLASYFDNLNITADGVDIKTNDEPLRARPTIVIEKIAPDNALYLRLDRSVDLDNERLVDSDGLPALSRLAVRHDDGHIVVRPITDTADELLDANAVLSAALRKAAPTKAARGAIYNDNNLYIIPEEVARPFLLETLPSLLGRMRLAGSDKLRDYKIRPVKPKLRISFSSGIDFLEGDATVDIDDMSISLGDFLQQYRTNRYIDLSDGSHAVVDPGFMRRLERIFKSSRKGGGHVKVSFFDLPEIEAMLESAPTGDKVLERPREFYNGLNSLGSAEAPHTAVTASLRPYQLYGVKWLRYLYDNNMGGCLADEMGLGKTLQTIALLTTIYPAEKLLTLIAMPRSLLFNWHDELRRFAPQLDVVTYYGPSRSAEALEGHQIVLTTYAIVRNDIETLSKVKFHAIILDESQNIKNIQTGISKSVLLLDAPHRFALSGTPVENNPGELYPLYRFLNPAMFGSIKDFDERYMQPIKRDGDTDAVEALRRRIFPFMLRRLKTDVLPELPELIDQTIFVDMDDEQARLYEQRRRLYLTRVNDAIAGSGLDRSRLMMLQALSELRRVASVPESLTDGRVRSPKLDLLAERIAEAVSNGHKTVVFFNFIAGIEIIGERLEREGIDYTTMTGSTQDRSNVVNRFQNDPSCMVLLMTLKTGGVGLNLTAADTVFIVEPWWNKAAELQAINRLHRFGQKSAVLCYSLITRGTIEEKIRELQQRKVELFDGLIGADDLTAKKLSEEDINFILS